MSYEEKYLKYKNKYLALKKQILALQNSQDQPVVERSGPSGISRIFNNFSLNNIFGGGEDKTETETTLPGMNSDVPEEINGGARGRGRGGRKSSSRKGRKTSSRKHSRNFLADSDEKLTTSSSSSSSSNSDSDFDSSELEWH